MAHATVDAGAALNGSARALRAVLSELAYLTGCDAVPQAPVLQLQFDAIVTLSTVETGHGAARLLVRALLPPLVGAGPATIMPVTAPDTACVWNAAADRVELWRRVGVSRLRDETAVLDAIAASGERAEAWLITARLALGLHRY